jgi:AraC-like DNA-binding protein
MSKKRQDSTDGAGRDDERILVRSFAVRYSHAHVIASHTHEWHQLIYASEGVMWVHTAQGEWVVPSNRAVWVPTGVEHGIEMSGTVFVRTLYLSHRVSSSLPRRCCAVNVLPLLRELILHIMTLGTLDRRIPEQSRLIGFLLDQLRVLPTIPLQLPLPSDERARRVAALIRTKPDEGGSLKQLTKSASASIRTLERLFQKETGMTFGKWRQQLRLLHALRLLADDQPVTTVATAVGYESTSAFIAAFKQYFGTTPSKYFE